MLRFEEFPPAGDDAQRLADYGRFELLLDGRHETAFSDRSAKIPPGKKSITYIVANFAGLVSKVCADLLFGEAVEIVVGEPETPIQQRLDEIVRRNQLQTMLWESACGNSARGDAVVKVWRAEDGLARIREMGVGGYFVERDPDDVREVLSEALAWKREVGDRCYLRVQHHMPGQVVNELFELSELGDKVERAVSLAALYKNPPPEVEETGIDRSLLFHIPNLRIGSRYFGWSDYQDLETLLDEGNNRLSKIASYLDRHAEPKLVVPPGVTDPKGRARASSLSVIEMDDAELAKVLPRYVTWDGKLEAAFDELDRILELLHKVSEIAPAAFGMDKSGAPDSGKALKLRFIRTLAKVSRKRNYYDAAIRGMLATALQLEGETAVTPDDIKISWKDGLPQDYSEAVTDETTRFREGLTSARSAVMRLDGVGQAEAEEELDRIHEEKKKGLELAPDVFGVQAEDAENGGTENQKMKPGMKPPADMME